MTKILIIYTGGTIGMVKDSKTGSLKPFDFSKISKSIPELKLLNCELKDISFEKPIDSSNVTPDFWVKLVALIADHDDKFDGFVILHGSDTMSYTASALSFMLSNLTKPVILTGSQLPIGDLRTDAKENLITAIQLATLQENNQPVIQEVCLYFEYKLYRGNRTTKISAEHFHAFNSPNFPALAESGVNLKVEKQLLLKNKKGNLKTKINICKEVVIVKLFPGLSMLLLESLMKSDIKAIVLETYGSGNAPNSPEFLNLLKIAKSKQIAIINVTQCSAGAVVMGKYETSQHLQQMGVIDGKDITTEAAITKAMVLLGENHQDIGWFKENFEKNLAGELSN